MRTNVPTWNQRVTYNNVVNQVLTFFNVSANVKSGDYTVRHGLEAMTERDWYNQKPMWVTMNEDKGYYVGHLED